MIRRLVVPALLLVLSACPGRPAHQGAPATFEGGWSKLPDSPLSARHEAHAFGIGDLILVVGGSTAPPCPPVADCIAPAIPPLRDGAALDLETKKWRSIARAPIPLGAASGVVSGRRLFLLVAGSEPAPGVRSGFLSYDADADRWTVLPAAPVPEDGLLHLVAAGDTIVAHFDTQEAVVRQDLAYDQKLKKWRTLPRDPLIPSFDRSMLWTGRKLMLVAPQALPQPNSNLPALYRAAELDLATGTWQRLANSRVVGYDPSWFFAGNLALNATVGSADGGTVNGWGQRFPFGGIFDPSAGTWSALPAAPQPGTYRGPAVANAEYVTTTGRVLNVRGKSWARLDLPAPIDGGYAVTWAGNSFAIWGGYVWGARAPRLLSDGWMWTPAT